MARSDPTELAGLDASSQQPLPGLSREALHRIAQAEKDARERYDRDTVPYFPMHPDFSFLEESVIRSIARILEYVRIFAEEVLDANLREYLEIAPSDLRTNEALLQSVARNAWTLTDQLWKGYGCTLRLEPTSRRAQYMMAMAAGTMDQHPELEPLRYPEGQQWADFNIRMAEPGSEMARLNARYAATIMKTIGDRIRRYQAEAASRLGMITEPQAQREKNQADKADKRVPNPAEQNISEPEPRPMEATNERAAADWEDIELFFIGDHDVEIRIGGKVQRRNYKEIAGFENRHTGKPSQLWAMLRVFGSLPNGTMPDDARNGKEWVALQKKIERTSNALRKHFVMTGDPFPYIRGTGYCARIKIRPTPDSSR